ncbi:hypothetical protein AURDEDRAFT_181784 [Auricularia subglabra TFB-10046 SS5]|nr:hypothetical protein AURDEDRAFT_181784 [Auricularia subglabra TFB-10046 SS5]
MRYSWATLPPELLFLILEAEPAALSAASSRRAHRQLLLACALVCKTWADIAQTIIFRHIHVEHSPEYRNVFARLVSTLSYLSHTKRFLPLATRTLAIDVGDHWLPHGKTCTHADTSSVALAVHLCSRLVHLRLHVREGVRHSFSESSLALLRTTRTVTKLSISADSSPMLPQLLHVWPQLTFLDSRTSSGFPSPVTPPNMPARCAIRELHASGTAPDSIARLAAPFACSLRALTLVSHQRTGAPPTRSLFDGSVPLPALESATLDCEFDAGTLDALPGGIAHLGLVFWDRALYAVLKAFVARRTGTLKALSLLAPRACTTGRDADESGLLDLCAQNGITVRYRTREELVTSGASWC